MITSYLCLRFSNASEKKNLNAFLWSSKLCMTCSCLLLHPNLEALSPWSLRFRHTGLSFLEHVQVCSHIRAFATAFFLSRIIFSFQDCFFLINSGWNVSPSKKNKVLSWSSCSNFLSPPITSSFIALITLWSHCIYLLVYCLFLPL